MLLTIVSQTKYLIVQTKKIMNVIRTQEFRRCRVPLYKCKITCFKIHGLETIAVSLFVIELNLNCEKYRNSDQIDTH